MALFNFNCFMNINFAQPNFSFGCFTMPNFFSNFSLFNFGCGGFNPFGQLGQIPYSNLFSNFGMMSTPSIFSNCIGGQNFSTPSFTNTPYTLNSPTSIFNTPSWDSSFTPTFSTPSWDSFSFSPAKTETKDPTNRKKETGYKSKFSTMTKTEAIRAAEASSYLEKLTAGNGWSVSSASFTNDIPYARKGMGSFLTRLSKEIGENLVVTSALGTATSPHAKDGGHYDETNPKLDFGGGLTIAAAHSLKSKLDNTGYFSRVEVEVDGNTAHLDVKVKESALQA